MKSRGFTFIEVLVAMAVMVLAGGFALFMSMETYRGTNFRSDRDLLVAVLQRARAQAIHNECYGTCTDGKAHGVHVQPDAYVLFQGAAYNSADPQNVIFGANASVTRTPATIDIVFSQLGGSSSVQTISLSGQGGSSVISIAANGRIAWTN